MPRSRNNIKGKNRRWKRPFRAAEVVKTGKKRWQQRKKTWYWSCHQEMRMRIGMWMGFWNSSSSSSGERGTWPQLETNGRMRIWVVWWSGSDSRYGDWREGVEFFPLPLPVFESFFFVPLFFKLPSSCCFVATSSRISFRIRNSASKKINTSASGACSLELLPLIQVQRLLKSQPRFFPVIPKARGLANPIMPRQVASSSSFFYWPAHLLSLKFLVFRIENEIKCKTNCTTPFHLKNLA